MSVLLSAASIYKKIIFHTITNLQFFPSCYELCEQKATRQYEKAVIVRGTLSTGKYIQSIGKYMSNSHTLMVILGNRIDFQFIGLGEFPAAVVDGLLRMFFI